ncbi:MAG: metallopeptidase family protein [Rhodobacter sp.]|nr:metallopeptidase family protein [Rhodobacter sp.]
MTNTHAEWTAPDLAAFERLAEAALDALPQPFRDAARKVAVRVEDFAPDHILREMGYGDAFELTGLYDGVPLTEKSTAHQPQQPDTIWLFRRPILDEWADRGNEPLGRLVAHILVHELAHHFGWSDADIAAIDRWWE